MRRLLPASLAAAIALLAGTFALAAGPPKAGPAAEDDGSGPPLAAYDAFVKGAEVQTGVFGVIRKDGKVYLALDKSQLDKEFYEHATTANGLGGFGILSGDDFQQPARIVKFERINEKHVAVVDPQYRFDAQPGSALDVAIRASTADSIAAILPIAAEDKTSGRIALDASFLLKDNLDLGNSLSDIVKNPDNPLGGYHEDPERSYFGPTKAFPQNVIVEAEQTYESLKPDTIDTVTDPHSIVMRVKYNFANVLSTPGYVPRIADDRVGYWDNPHLDFGRDARYDDLVRYVTRWNIRASDPSKPSPAVRPLVYTLTNTIPPEYRAPIREAILEWNKPFAKIGILDAIQVRDQPADADFDPDDIRYNTIRWLTEANGGGFAEAQIEWDPRTGEIFRSGVLIDADMMRFGKFEYADVVSPEAHRPHGFLHRDAEARAQAAYGALALRLDGESVPASYTHDFLKGVVLHEVGHDFGLAHNFIGHNAYTAKQLQSKDFTDANGVASSVMEYAPVNLWPRGVPHGDYFQTVPGPYDYHVIHWGYAPVPGATDARSEVPTLDRWAQAATDPKFAFASDEDVQFDGHAVDPRIAQWQLTGDAIGWCTTQLGIANSLFSTMDARFPHAQESWDEERFAVGMLARQYGRCTQTMTHFVGAERLSRARRGDPNAPLPLAPYARAEERRAFDVLDAYLFADTAWRHVSPATMRRTTYSEYEPIDNFGYVPTARHDLSLADLVGALQNRALSYMFAPLVLARLADLPAKTLHGETSMTLADLFTWTQAGVYGDLSSGRPGRTAVRRNLQRSYARTLERLALAPPAGTPYDAQALARHELGVLLTETRRSEGASLDLQTRAHLEALDAEVRRTLATRNVDDLRESQAKASRPAP